ncbi:ParB/RepB/Spo0J family partition protein [Salinisphaera hydrothermalis]|uniref:Probable chromosome-partitioning protein ParB n=1 Tax=Salinisphaera hydrothermalis (strain C41B8) TaxID=1304275 RepID=A0A084IJ99_SALHC|nr:ParB/RepB/Spo0J family partition protein [Salinisphaera hydrothermalis]KEZ76783.1 parB-like partition protein [Salinisphaera hydrothermalis C41B8]
MSTDIDKPFARPEHRIARLPIESIARDPHQARTRFDDAGLAELADSIRESGVIQPVVVTGDPEQGFRLLAGERRWRAAQRAGLAELPAIIRNDLDPEQARVLGLIENLQRESLGVMDTAHGLARLGESHGLTHDAIAARIGKSRAYVSNFLRLRQLAEPVQAMLDEHILSIGHGKILAGLDAATQIRLARRAAAERVSVRRLELWVREQSQPRSEAAAAAPPELAALEQQLAEHVGNSVRIHYNANRRRGELRIAFHDLDEFEGLLARLGFDPESAD